MFSRQLLRITPLQPKVKALSSFLSDVQTIAIEPFTCSCGLRRYAIFLLWSTSWQDHLCYPQLPWPQLYPPPPKANGTLHCRIWLEIWQTPRVLLRPLKTSTKSLEQLPIPFQINLLPIPPLQLLMAHLLHLTQAVTTPLEDTFPSARRDDLLTMSSCFLERARVLMTVMQPSKERRIWRTV